LDTDPQNHTIAIKSQSNSIWRTIADCLIKTALPLSCLLIFSGIFVSLTGQDKSAYIPSKAAADRCSKKLKTVEEFASKRKPGRKQVTQFSQDEINSYLALDLSAKYHPCLKSLMITLEENELQAVAAIDFNQLKSAPGKLLPKLVGLMFTGTHTLTARGQLLSKDGKAKFILDQARFDDNTLPRYLVEQIISAVGRRQNPPFDPLQPSKIFYEIEKAEIHANDVIVYQ
jgi:hypothetical protein